MKELQINSLYTLEETIAADLFEGATYPWEVLPKIKDFIIALGKTLPADKFDEVKENVWLAKSANVYPTAHINGPAIIDEDAEVRHCAFIRGNAIVGEGAVVGNSTELKNVVLFNRVQVPHYNYVGDSVLGFRAHMAEDRTVYQNTQCPDRLIEHRRRADAHIVADKESADIQHLRKRRAKHRLFRKAQQTLLERMIQLDRTVAIEMILLII